MKFDRFDTTTDEANLVLSAYTTFTKALFSSTLVTTFIQIPIINDINISTGIKDCIY